jgi:uncharacterized membrane protein
MVVLGDLPNGQQSLAHGASADGLRVVGTGSSTAAPPSNGREASLWDDPNAPVPLGDLAGGSGSFGFRSALTDASADGTTLIGQGTSDDGIEALRWTNAEGLVGLGGLPAGTTTPFLSTANAVSPDGSIIVGQAASGADRLAFRWTQAGGMESLGDLPGGGVQSLASDLSADGSVIVGSGAAGSTFENEASVWTEASGMIGLGFLPGEPHDSRATAVSANGSIIGGWASRLVPQEGVDEFGDPLPPLELGGAVTWRNGGRIILFEDSLTALGLGAEIDGWLLHSIDGISSDGQTFVGTGTNPSGFTEGWIAFIPKAHGLPMGDHVRLLVVGLIAALGLTLLAPIRPNTTRGLR